ncbi:flagellar filament capping protein FliD [bacterium]|nr:flagellar filament capping protein FliD [bacterium]
MSETISNDYISMINKQGSGYNIPVIVDAIVDAAIAPIKTIVTTQKDGVDGAVSGMASLKSSALLSQTTINNLSGDDDFVLGSTDGETVSLTMNDRSKLDGFSHKITNVTTAKPMVMHVKNWTSLTTDLYIQDHLDITVNGAAIGASHGGVPGRMDIDSDTATELTKKLDAISGINAQMVKVSDNSYTMVVTSEPGSTFTIVSSSTSSTDPLNTSGSHGDTDVTASSNASLTFNGVAITRSNNAITDLIDGVTINLLADNAFDNDANTAAPETVETSITASRSPSKIQETVESLIAELNAYKADLNALGFIDEVGDEDGQLANNAYLRSVRQDFLRLMTEPISGYGDTDIHFVEFGIKTALDGSYIFDKTTFDRTYSQEPEKFNALTQDKAYSSDPNVLVYATTTSSVPSGKHVFAQTGKVLSHSGTASQKTLTSSASGDKFDFTTDDYPGFLFQANDDTSPGNFDIYIGRSAKTKLSNFFANAQKVNGSHDKFVDFYKDQSSDLSARLAKIDKQELLLRARYTEQFSKMETAVTGSKASQDYITQLVDGWNKS